MARTDHDPQTIPSAGSAVVTGALVDATTHYQAEFRYRIWNSKKSAIVDVSVVRVPVPGSGRFTVFVEATVQ